MFFSEFKLPDNPIIPNYTVNIKDFIINHESTDIGESVKLAIEHLASLGGGKLVIPEGEYISGPIHLKSNIELSLEEGAVVRFDPDPKRYLPVVFTTYGGIRCYNYSPLLYGRNLKNVSITGKGTFDGCGEEWWKWSKNMTAREILYHSGLPLEERVFGTPEYGLRPMFLQILESSGVLIEGVKFVNSPCWTVNTVWCQDVIVRGITVENPTVSPNTDGVNVESCNRVLVEDCTIVTTGDDMFCIKAGRNEDAWEVGIPCENVVIRNCRSLGPSRSGGIVIGSEMSAGVNNILAENCEFSDNLNCIRFKAKDGRGGYVKNVSCRNIRMKKGMRGINLSYRYSCEATDDAKEPGKYMPVFSQLSFKNITCDEVESGITLDGIPGGKMEDIHFENITMNAKICFTSDSVSDINMKNVKLNQII